MPIKLNDGGPMFGELIDKKTIEAMVNVYRKKNEDKDKVLRHAHFAVLEILELFHANGIITVDTLELIKKTHPEIENKKLGLKIYLGTHSLLDDCPGKKAKYLQHDTTIICNTVLKNAQDSEELQWEDLLGDNKDSIIFFGLDKTSICPPDCKKTFDGNRIISI